MVIKKIAFSLFVTCLIGCSDRLSSIEDIPFVEMDDDSEIVPEINPDKKIIFPSKVYHVYNDKEFQESLDDIKDSGLKLYKMGIFTASWCPPCQKIKPTIEKWPSVYKNNIAFIFIHMDNSRQSNGNPVDRKTLLSLYSNIMKCKAYSEGYADDLDKEDVSAIPHIKFRSNNFIGSDKILGGKLEFLMEEVQ